MCIEPSDFLAQLNDDNRALAVRLRQTHNLCEEYRDVATASLIDPWFEAGRPGDSRGR
jgi:starvation-inducible DNA-binding protein